MLRIFKIIKSILDFINSIGTAIQLLIGFGLLSVISTAILYFIGWGKKVTEVQNWILAALLLSSILLLITWVIFLWKFFRKDHDNLFVIDPTFEHLWEIKLKPEYWRDVELEAQGSNYLNSLISGPFHSEHGCSTPLYGSNSKDYNPGIYDNHGNDVRVVFGNCSLCRKQLPFGDLFDGDVAWRLSGFKLAVLKEIQRVYRVSGTVKHRMKIHTLPPKVLQELMREKQS